MADAPPTIQLQTWDPASIRTPFAALLVASRNSGKSTLVRSLWTSTLRHHFDMVVCFCPTDFDGDYRATFDNSGSKLFYRELRPEVLQRLMDAQEARRRAGRKMARVLLVLDDLSTSRERYDDMLKHLYTRGRHYQVSIIFSTQATQLTDTVWRNNSDYVWVGRQISARSREMVVEQFLMGTVDEDELPPGSKEKTLLKRVLKQNTKDHSFVVIDYATGTGDIDDTVFRYKAPALPKVA